MSSPLEFSVIDDGRHERIGIPEVIYGEGKSIVQLGEILRHYLCAGKRLLVTRLCEDKALALQEEFDRVHYDPVSRLLWSGPELSADRRYQGQLSVVCAGTSDIPVAEEAALTAEWFGVEVTRVWDVGVAGIHRLFDRIEEIRRAKVVVVVAGMEGALPSVVAGLVPAPVIAVPTSVGYGANLGGLTTMLAMMTACSAGVTVVNIDNGFGAAAAALRMMPRAF
jgi:NCAIR mutase (PurE)-related protein